jgi:methionyl-tRNA formyltransferase
VTKTLRVGFLGNDVRSVPSLEALAGSPHDVVSVVTAVPKPAGRGNELTPTPVAVRGRALGLPVEEVESVRTGHGFKVLAQAVPEILVVVAYGELLTPNVLSVPSVAPVNVHFSLLPELRGASPVETALLLGLERTGVTTIVMDRGLDTGPVVLQRTERIGPDDDAGSLGERLARIGGDLLLETLERFAAGPVAPRAQDHTLATFAPKFGAEDRVLDWSNPARVLVNLARALAPEPGATTTFRGAPMKILRAEATAATGEPGRIVDVSKEGIVIATAAGGFRPLDVVPAGRNRMRGPDLVNGFRPEVGERLG